MHHIYHDGTYLENNPSWHEEDSPWKALQIIKIIERNSLNPRSICELGCGAGEILSQLSEYFGPGVNLCGYEISPQAYEICSKKKKDNLDFRLKDLFQDDSEYFDIVMAIDVFEHVEDYFDLLRKLRTRGKYKIFHVPLALSVSAILRATPIIESRKSVGHIHYFNKEIAIESLKDTGYEIIDYFYTERTIDRPPPGWRSKLMRYPRKIAFSLNKDLAARILGGFSLMVLAK